MTRPRMSDSGHTRGTGGQRRNRVEIPDGGDFPAHFPAGFPGSGPRPGGLRPGRQAARNDGGSPGGCPEAVGENARLVVRDEGIGIPPEAQERIFGKFERAVSERHSGGLGLGLYITRSIVEAMGGVIQVESCPGEGSTFTVDLPRAHPPETRR